MRRRWAKAEIMQPVLRIAGVASGPDAATAADSAFLGLLNRRRGGIMAILNGPNNLRRKQTTARLAKLVNYGPHAGRAFRARALINALQHGDRH